MLRVTHLNGFFNAREDGGTPPPLPPEEYIANAVDYDGTNDWLSRSTPFAGALDAGVGLFSVSVKRSSVAGNEQHIMDMNGTGGRYSFVFSATASSDRFYFYAQRGANVFYVIGSTEITADGNWHNILVEWDHNQPTSSRLVRMYVDNTLQTNAVVTNTGVAFTVDLSAISDIKVAGSAVGTTNNVNGGLAELYFAHGVTLNTSIAENRELFIVDGKPAGNLLTTGAPSPLIYLPNSAATVNINAGTGGNMTVNGTPSDASSSPSD